MTALYSASLATAIYYILQTTYIYLYYIYLYLFTQKHTLYKYAYIKYYIFSSTAIYYNKVLGIKTVGLADLSFEI